MTPKENTKTTCLRCGKPAKQRGLCATHYSQYYKEIERLNDAEKALYEKALIAADLLEPPKRRGPQPNEDPYAVVAAKIKSAAGKTGDSAKVVERIAAETKLAYGRQPTKAEEAAMVDAVIAEGDEIIRKAVTKRKATQKPTARQARQRGK